MENKKEKFEYHKPSVVDKLDGETFQRYVEDLRLQPEDFGKKILDLGAGAGQFSKWAKKHGVSSRIYSVDHDADLPSGENAVMGKAEALPFSDNSFDLVVSDAAIPHIFIGIGNQNEVEDRVSASLKEALRVVKPGGEIRLARVLMGNRYENQKAVSQSIQKTLSALKQEYGAEVIQEHIPADDDYEYEGRKKKHLLAKSYLITIKKSQ